MTLPISTDNFKATRTGTGQMHMVVGCVNPTNIGGIYADLVNELYPLQYSVVCFCNNLFMNEKAISRGSIESKVFVPYQHSK